MSNPSQKAIYSSRSQSQMAPHEKVFFRETLGLTSETPGKSNAFDRGSPVFEKEMKERGSMDEHFTLAGSA